MDIVFFSGGGGSVTNDISFHARVGRFSSFLYLRSVAIAVILFWLLVVLVSRVSWVPVYLVIIVFHVLLYSSVVSESRRS